MTDLYPSELGEPELLAQLIERSPTGLVILSPMGQILYANARLCTLMHCDSATLTARRFAELVTTETARHRLGECLANVCTVLDADARCEFATDLRRADGDELSVRIQLSRLPTARRVLAVAFIQDITELAQQAYLLDAIATYDDLTGLPNRMQLPALAAAQRARGERGALFLIDLDRFRRVNEHFGHDLGDLLLVAVSARLRDCLPVGAALARFSGDVLVAVVGDQERVQADALAQHLLAVMSEPVVINDWEYALSLSLGGVLFPDDGDDLGQLIRKADLALGCAKAGGGCAYAFYDGEIAKRVERRHRLLSLLRKAIEREELRLEYQPQVDLASGGITGWEALLRWHTPSEGAISPAEMIPIAEESGLILEIGDWVLCEAIAQQGRWKRMGLVPGIMAVNLSPRQLRIPGFVVRIASLLAEHEVPAEELELEITEGSLMEDVATAQHVLTELSRMGVKLAVDDFGTGYSSLAYLRAFPLNRLKIDRSFVQGLGSDVLQESIARAIIVLAHSLELAVVAEGVETQAQLHFLIDNGCEEIQGFIFSRTLPAADCERLLRDCRRLSISRARDARLRSDQG